MKQLLEDLKQFAADRKWWQYHRPAELSRAISIEAAELSELYLWGKRPIPERVQEELADIMIYCLNFANAEGYDPIQICRDKMAKNAIKYPLITRVEDEYGYAKIVGKIDLPTSQKVVI